MVIFGTGVVTGGLLVHHAEGARDRHPARSGSVLRTSVSPGSLRIEFLRRMERELDLAPSQREPVDRILREGQDRMKKVMESIEPRRREEYKRTMDEFRQVLTPEQRQRLDRMIKQQQQQRPRKPSGNPHESLPRPLPPAGTVNPGTNQ